MIKLFLVLGALVACGDENESADVNHKSEMIISPKVFPECSDKEYT